MALRGTRAVHENPLLAMGLPRLCETLADTLFVRDVDSAVQPANLCGYGFAPSFCKSKMATFTP